MAWMLQPHNYAQALRPNLYRVDYKRNAAYKGMGRGLGQACANEVCPDYPDMSTCYCPPTTPTCFPDSWVGPLQPGQVYCNTGTNIPSVTAAPLTAAQGAVVSNWLPWVIGGILVIGLIAGKR